MGLKNRSRFSRRNNPPISLVPSFVSQVTSSVVVTSGDATIITPLAGETLSGHRAVYIADNGKAFYSAPDDSCRRTVGLTTGAAVLNATASIQTDGVLTEPTWSWTGNEPIYLVSNGMLTQTVPTTGYVFQIGVPAGPTKLRIEPQLIARIS